MSPRAAPIRLAFGSQARPEFVLSCAITASKRCPGNRRAKIFGANRRIVPAERQGNDPIRRAHADEVDRPLRRAMLIKGGVSRLALASRSEPDWHDCSIHPQHDRAR